MLVEVLIDGPTAYQFHDVTGENSVIVGLKANAERELTVKDHRQIASLINSVLKENKKVTIYCAKNIKVDPGFLELTEFQRDFASNILLLLPDLRPTLDSVSDSMGANIFLKKYKADSEDIHAACRWIENFSSGFYRDYYRLIVKANESLGLPKSKALKSISNKRAEAEQQVMSSVRELLPATSTSMRVSLNANGFYTPPSSNGYFSQMRGEPAQSTTSFPSASNASPVSASPTSSSTTGSTAAVFGFSTGENTPSSSSTTTNDEFDFDFDAGLLIFDQEQDFSISLTDDWMSDLNPTGFKP